MRIGLLALSSILFLSCAQKKFSGSAQTGSAEAKPEVSDPEPAPVDHSPQPTNEIEFGADEVFRIGDGSSGANSACIGEVKSHDLKGTSYFFQFEVLEDNSKVEFAIGKFCGVDQANFTAVALQKEDKSAIGSELSVPTDASGSRATPYAPFAAQTLKKGIYQLVIISKNTKGTVTADAGDSFDDFVVGNIQIKSNKKVKELKVFTE